MGNDGVKTTFSDLASALANDYESIYLIKSEDDSYVEYSASGAEKELAIVSSGDDFYADTVINCRKMVWPEDQSFFLRSFKKENIIKALENGDSFCLRYRLNIDNKPIYFSLKSMMMSNGDIVIGVQNIDKVVRRQQKDNEKYAIYAEIAKSLGSMFEVIYYIDIQTGHYIEYYSSESFSNLIKGEERDDFFLNLQTDIEKHIYPEDREMLLFELEKTNLLNTLKTSNSYSAVYRQMVNDEMRYVSLFATKQGTDEEHLVIAVRNVDTQARNEADVLPDSQLFNEVAIALAQRYEVIYCVDVETNEYTEYFASKDFAKLEEGGKGKDFFIDTQNRMRNEIHPDDLHMMSVAMDKTKFMKNLEESGKLFLSYRLIIDGEPLYMALFAVRPMMDSNHTIIAVANIDFAKRKELEFEQKFGGGVNLSNRDPLTGLYNKRFYVQNEMRIDNAIYEENNLKFAVVVCDINGLRDINDKRGIKAGDDYINEAADLLKSVFTDVDIYRVGGDEFCIILMEDKYEDRGSYIDKLVAQQLFNKDNAKATVAYGISEYKPDRDMKVQDVYERAQKAMIVNKKSLRALLDKSDTTKADKFLTTQSDDQKTRFYELFIKLVSLMTDLKASIEANTPEIENILVEICSMFRLSKAVTRLYKNPKDEVQGIGETLSCYDTGVDGEEIISFRVVTSVMSIGVMRVYMSKDETPLAEEEKWYVELTMRTVLSYVTRNRLKDMVYELAYFDDFGYGNQRNYMNYLMQNRDRLNGMIAIRYNLLHFILVNQELGRVIGDKVMRRHYEGLKEIIGKDGKLVRLGGDNFMAIFGYQKMGNVFTYLRETPVIYDSKNGKSVNISCTVGVYRLPKNEKLQDPGIILEKTTIAFFNAKAGGNEKVVFFDDSLVANREQSMNVQRMFPEAIRNEEFKVYYQPKVHTETGRIIGAEALCRWFHEGEMISPGQFIPMLEETDDICTLDFYMFEHVCRDIRRWLDQGMTAIRISVNLSRKHMHNSSPVETLLKIIDRHNVPHSCIEVELTETTTDVNFADIKRVVNGLQSVGIFTSVDDFGMGYSSLNLIRELPWNVLKVDKSFLPTEEDNATSINSIMFRNVIAMVNEMGIDCIVEGVETEKQLEILRNNNCFYAQGFLFDRPLPVEDFEQRMAKGYYEVN